MGPFCATVFNLAFFCIKEVKLKQALTQDLVSTPSVICYQAWLNLNGGNHSMWAFFVQQSSVWLIFCARGGKLALKQDLVVTPSLICK